MYSARHCYVVTEEVREFAAPKFLAPGRNGFKSRVIRVVQANNFHC